jgi:hypothetical protein
MLRDLAKLLFVLSACSEAQTGSLQPTPPWKEPPVADILFVLDNSGGSLSKHERLIAAIPRLLAPLEGADLRIGVITTDVVSQNGERQGTQEFVFSPDFPWILTNFSGSDCEDITPKLEHGCAHGSVLDSKALAPRELLQSLQMIIGAVGNCGSGTEQAFRAAIAALNHRSDCNADLFREGTKFVLIHVGDDEEASNVPIDEVVASFADRIPPERTRMAMIVGEVDGVAVHCGRGIGTACGSLCDTPPSPGSHTPCTRNQDCTDGEVCVGNQCENPSLQYWGSCSSCSFYRAPDCCEAHTGGRFVEVARALGDRALLGSVCDEDYGDTLERIAIELIIGATDGGG